MLKLSSYDNEYYNIISYLKTKLKNTEIIKRIKMKLEKIKISSN